MANYLKEVTDLATWFGQIGQPKSPAEVNNRILVGPDED